jgi:hypothetical protein
MQQSANDAAKRAKYVQMSCFERDFAANRKKSHFKVLARAEPTQTPQVIMRDKSNKMRESILKFSSTNQRYA